MWEAVRPDCAAMSRKMGTGAVDLATVGPAADWIGADFCGAIFAAGPPGFWAIACVNSKQTVTETRLKVCADGMECDCNWSQCCVFQVYVCQFYHVPPRFAVSY